MSYLECPYCEHDCGDHFDDCYEQDVEYEHECQECGKNFIYIIEYSPNFTGHKADCLNGSDCDFQPICGYPKEYFENKRRCSMCSKEITVENDAVHAKSETEDKNA